MCVLALSQFRLHDQPRTRTRVHTHTPECNNPAYMCIAIYRNVAASIAPTTETRRTRVEIRDIASQNYLVPANVIRIKNYVYAQ